MNKLILPILLFLFGCSKHIQQEISTTDYKDSILKKLDHLSIENPDSSINYTKHLLQVDSLFIDSAFYYSLIENIARCKFNMGEPDSSLYYFSAPLQYWEKGKTNEARKKHAQLLYNYAFTLKESGNLKRSLNFFNKSIEVAKNTDNAKLLISPYLLKSEILASEDNYGEAIECIENSIVACSAIKDSALMISCLQAYADIYVNCNFYKEAEMQFDETIKGISNNYFISI